MKGEATKDIFVIYESLIVGRNRWWSEKDKREKKVNERRRQRRGAEGTFIAVMLMETLFLFMTVTMY